MAGHIKLDRKILEWEWYTDANVSRLFIHLLLIANYKETKWRGTKVSRGQVLTGLLKLTEDTGLSIRQLRTAFDKLVMTGEITFKSTNKFRIVTICKYDSYQSFKEDSDKQNDKQIDSQTTSERQSNDKPPTTSNKDNNIIKKEEYNIRGAGDLASPAAPASTSGFNYLPDGRSYIEPTLFFTQSDFNGLPENNNSAIRIYMSSVKGIEVEPKSISDLWEVFKVQELTFQKPYRNKDDVYRHFLNWAKKQSFSKRGVTPVKRIEAAGKKGPIIGVEWATNFSQCKMNDGSLVDLDENQSVAARYNQISPKTIKK